MSAVAGCIGGAATDYREISCARMLEAQSELGQRVAVSSLGDASFAGATHSDFPNSACHPTVTSRCLLTADARLFNRDDLAGALDLADQNLADDAIILAAWEKWGHDCFDRLVGEFALAIWDDAEGSLILARDPTGQRPLCYAITPELVAFSTMTRGILAVPEFRRGFEMDRVASTLSGVPDYSDTTYFAGVSRVRPGCAVRIRAGRLSAWRHWRPPQDELRLSDDDFVEAYRDALDTAVIAALEGASARVAVHLSSGFDSSAVAATAADLSPNRKVIAFTSAPRADFDGPVPKHRIADESTLAGATARQHSVEHVVVRAQGHIFDQVRRHCRLYEEPLCDWPNMHWVRAVARQVQERDIALLLTGEMGNLSLNAGGLPALAEWLRRGDLRSWWKEASAASHNSAASWNGILYNSFGHRIPGWGRRALTRRFLGAPAASERSFARNEPSQRAARDESPLDSYRGRYASRFQSIAAYDIGAFRKGALSEFGFDERDPTADRRLLDFSFRLPPEQLLHRGVWRPLAQRALADRLPAEVLNASMRGYQGADWYEHLTEQDARDLFEEIEHHPIVNDAIDLPKLRAAIDCWPNGGWADARTISIYRVQVPIALATGIFLQEFAASVS